jgi:hypothetical protein
MCVTYLTGRGVRSLIYQPRSSIYAMTDSICLLSQGKCVYYGPGGASCHEYFAGLRYPVPPVSGGCFPVKYSAHYVRVTYTSGRGACIDSPPCQVHTVYV